MVSFCAHIARYSLCLSFVVAPLFTILTFLSADCHAQSPIVQIEEDWELVVSEPDVNSNGPQLACTFSPVCNIEGLHASFELNHRSAPDFASGGLHLHVWYGEALSESKASPDNQQLSAAGEKVTWTQRMEVKDGNLILEVVNGQSTTWGAFGNEGTLKAVVQSDLTNLDEYTPTVSMQNSGVTYASNCVEKLVLKRVRATRADGTVVTVVLDSVIHQYISDN